MRLPMGTILYLFSFIFLVSHWPIFYFRQIVVENCEFHNIFHTHAHMHLEKATIYALNVHMNNVHHLRSFWHFNSCRRLFKCFFFQLILMSAFFLLFHKEINSQYE